MRNAVRVAVLNALFCFGGTATLANEAMAQVEVQSFSIAPGSLDAALRQFSSQTRIQLIYPTELVDGKSSDGLSGSYSSSDALKKLLFGSGLASTQVNEKTVVLKAAASEARQSTSKDVRSPLEEVVITAGIPEILVLGKKSLNMDIERTENDPLPYVVLDAEEIQRSGASDLNEFLMTRVPMSATGRTTAQGLVGEGNTSSVNLRGLGANQTLILIDGRRAAKTSTGITSGQPDLNGIPLSAIERIEILPTTASAIYGGSATGGVVNVVLRRDYEGIETSVTYDNSFDGDSASKRVDIAGGMNLFDGKTAVFVAGSYAESNALRINERDFVEQGRRKIMQNFPNFITVPFSSTSANVRSANGANLVLDNGTALNSPYTFAPVGYAGRASDGGAALRANAGAYNMSLSDTAAQSQTSSAGGTSGGNFPVWGGNPPQKYVSGSIRHEFSEQIKVFLEASHSNNDTRQGGVGVNLPGSNIAANAPSNPFGQSINVAWSTRQLAGYIETESSYDRYSGGAIFSLPWSWNASIDYTLSDSKLSMTDTTPYFGSATAFYAAINAGTIDVLRDFDSQGIDIRNYVLSNYTRARAPLKVTTKNPALRLGGPVGELPGGSPQVSLLIERQDTEFGDTVDFSNGGTSGVLYPKRTQRTDSAYLELRLPIVSSANALPWLREFELQLAARWDQYESDNAGRVRYTPPATPVPVYVSNKSHEVSPLVALRLKPIDSVMFRASYGEGFLPPDVNQLGAPELVSQFNIAPNNVIDPRRGNTVATGLVDILQQGNPNLIPEESRTWSAGLILQPTWLDGLRLSVDYTKIEKENAIIFPNFAQILEIEAQFPERVTRGANLPGDAAGWAGPIRSIDLSMMNLANVISESYDFQLDYDLDLAAVGNLRFFALGTWQKKLDTQASPQTAVVDSVGWTSGDKVLEWRANAGVQWSRDRWSAGWNTRYFDSYYVADPASLGSVNRFLAQGNGGRIPSQTYHDLFGSYDFGAEGTGRSGLVSLLDGVQVRAGVRNVFNKKPPYDVSSSFYYYSGLADPRLATYYLTIRKSF